jgi:hypothetical protein
VVTARRLTEPLTWYSERGTSPARASDDLPQPDGPSSNSTDRSA